VSYELDLMLIIVPASCGLSQTCSLLYLKKVRYLLLSIYPLFLFLKFFRIRFAVSLQIDQLQYVFAKFPIIGNLKRLILV